MKAVEVIMERVSGRRATFPATVAPPVSMSELPGKNAALSGRLDLTENLSFCVEAIIERRPTPVSSRTIELIGLYCD